MLLRPFNNINATNLLGNGRRKLSSRAAAVLQAVNLPTDDVQRLEMDGTFDGQWRGTGELLDSICPSTGEILAKVKTATPSEVESCISRARSAFHDFRFLPGPKRGDILRQIRQRLDEKKTALGELVSLEMGKIRTEGIGEVQEFVDICDYAVGLSRMMNGRVVSSERVGHSILEVPNPLGTVAVLSAFNFPVAVYGWNLALSLASGNTTIWKPSPTTPLCAIAITKLIADVLKQNGVDGAIASLLCGSTEVGKSLAASRDVNMVSFTGSEAVGRKVGIAVQERFGKVLLELGGNNAAVIMPDADMKMAVTAVGFGAIGTAGQRCTSTRRLFLHRRIADSFVDSLAQFYGSASTKQGDPLNPSTLIGPLHTRKAVENYAQAVSILEKTNADFRFGSPQSLRISLSDSLNQGNFVQPTIVIPEPPSKTEESRSIWHTETFAPLLKVAVFDTLEEVIELNNSVPQGLSSTLWTRDIGNIGKWLGPGGSDCGIVNVNAGTSGAEIGAAFGGNKSTGWGRESGGDAWKQYVRWSACTVNYSDEMPLAQGVSFDVA